MPESVVLHAQQVVFPHAPLQAGWVEYAGSTILAVGTGEPPGHRSVRRLGDVTLAPGFVDMHVHGGGGAAFTDGADAAHAVLQAHRSRGTTTMVASLVTDTLDALEYNIMQLVPLVKAGQLAGIHLEGPWLCEQYCGAHNPDLLKDPTVADLQRLMEAGAGCIRMVTIAPERMGAIEAIRWLRARGVVVAVGHTCATQQQVAAAVAAGAQVATHLFNAMPAIHHRDPGPVPLLLNEPNVVVELIADGVHVHPSVLSLAVNASNERFVLVTDAMAAAGQPDGAYRLGPLDVEVLDSVARVCGTGAIAGSTLMLEKAVKYAVTAAGIPIEKALRAATLTPANVLGCRHVGRIARGARADFVVLDARCDVLDVFVGGQLIAP